MRIRFLSAILIVLAMIIAPGARAQSGDLTVYSGSVVYADPAYDSVALVEFPFALARDEFEFFRPTVDDTNLYARVFAQLDLINTEGIAIDSASTYFSVRAATATEASRKGIRLFNKLMLFVRPGVYSARLTVIDAVSKRTGSVFLDRVIVPPSTRDHISLGGPELAFNVMPVTDSTRVNMRLVKNGYLVIPNPVSVFSESDTTVFLYGEVYNLEWNNKPADFRVSFLAVDQNDSLYRSFGSRSYKKPGTSAAFGEALDIYGFRPGAYRLLAIASDPATGQADTGSVRFAVVSPEAVAIAAARVKQGTSADTSYDDLTLEEKGQLVFYLLTPQQKKTLNSLTNEGKETFLNQYWAESNTNPRTGETVDRTDLIRRFRFANARFSTNETRDDGWSTDRGRVYMTYGHWDEIDDFKAPRVGPPYQIWYFQSIEEGKVFVFIDERGNEEYRLVHSNVYGEIYSQEWADRLKGVYQEGIDDM